MFGGSWSDKPPTLTCRDSRLRGVQAPVLSVLPYSGPLSYLFPVFSRHLFASAGAEAVPEEQLLSCGASDCLMALASANSMQRPSQTLIYTLLGIYTGTCSPRAESLRKKSAFPECKYSCETSPGSSPCSSDGIKDRGTGRSTSSLPRRIVFLLQSSVR